MIRGLPPVPENLQYLPYIPMRFPSSAGSPTNVEKIPSIGGGSMAKAFEVRVEHQSTGLLVVQTGHKIVQHLLELSGAMEVGVDGEIRSIS